MSYMIPTWEVSVENKKLFRQAVIECLINQALRVKISGKRFELNVRSLLPSDLGLETWDTPPQATHTTVPWIHYELDQKVVGLYKIVQLSENPTVSEIGVAPPATKMYDISQLYGLIPLLKKLEGTDDLEILQIQYGLENLRMEGWFTEPHIFDSHIAISVTSNSSEKTNGDKLVLVGFVIEKDKYS